MIKCIYISLSWSCFHSHRVSSKVAEWQSERERSKEPKEEKQLLWRFLTIFGQVFFAVFFICFAFLFLSCVELFSIIDWINCINYGKISTKIFNRKKQDPRNDCSNTFDTTAKAFDYWWLLFICFLLFVLSFLLFVVLFVYSIKSIVIGFIDISRQLNGFICSYQMNVESRFMSLSIKQLLVYFFSNLKKSKEEGNQKVFTKHKLYKNRIKGNKCNIKSRKPITEQLFNNNSNIREKRSSRTDLLEFSYPVLG